MTESADLNTDWQRSAGDFSCSVCERKRLPASEFSKKQVERALESIRSIPDKDIRTGPEIQHTLYLTAVCKKCTEAKEEAERAAAEAKRNEREEAAAATELQPPERMPVTLAERPFGMTPSKAEGVGYLVAKVSEGKPAAKAGVRAGWHLAEIGGKHCGDLDLEAAQAELKAAALPVDVVFEAVPGGADFCTACQRVLPIPLFSRKMRTKPPEKRRCSACVEASEAGEGDGAEGAPVIHVAQPKGKLGELAELCKETAREAEVVTGLRAVRGGSRAGRGRGRR